jgi:hypothetical protein
MENIITETDGLNTTLLMTQISKYEMRIAKKNWRLRLQPLIIHINESLLLLQLHYDMTGIRKHIKKESMRNRYAQIVDVT